MIALKILVALGAAAGLVWMLRCAAEELRAGWAEFWELVEGGPVEVEAP